MKRCTSSAALRLLPNASVRRPADDELGQQPRRVAERARPLAELLVEQRRVPERDRPLGARCAVVVDDRGLDAEQRLGQLAGVGDRRRGEQEARLRAVDAGEPAQPPEHVAHVRAEDAAVDVRLVDHDVARGSRARRPSGRGAAARRRGACPGWSGSGSTTCGSASAARWACRRRRSRRGPSGRAARRARAPGPARAPSSGRGRAPASSAARASASSTGRLNASVLPLAVPVATTTCSPRATASQAVRWCVNSSSIPRAASASRTRGWSSSGSGAVRAARAGSVVR